MFAKETLPAPPPEGAPRPARPGIARLLFAGELLGQDPAPGGPERRGLLSSLFGREPLPLDPQTEPRRRSHWLAWLFAPERLDGG
ncbi:MAG: hypothetical protein ACXWLA_12235 [Myxococcaceae bacterium]